MTRGGTPTFVVQIEDIDFAQIKQIYATIKQGNIELTKKIDQMTISDKTITFTYSQQETFRLKQGTAQLQLKLLTTLNKVLFTEAFDIEVSSTLSNEVIK